MKTLFRQDKQFYKTLLTLAVPLILQNLINSSLGMIDTYMLGSLGDTIISAVTLANAPFFFVILIVFGIQSGGSVLISQYHGLEDYKTINRVMGVSYAFCSVFALIVTTVMTFFPEQVVALWTDKPEMAMYASRYMRIVSYSYFINCLATIYIGAHRSMGNPKLGMIVHSVAMVVNTILNYVLIYGKLGFPELGIEGAAIATFIARAVELALTILYARFNTRFKLMWKYLFNPGKEIIRDYIKYALPVVANEGLWGLGFSVYPAIFGRMSSAYVAAYTIAGNVDRIVFTVVFGLGSAVAVIIGNEIGAKKGNIYETGRSLLAICVSAGFVSAAICYFSRSFIVGRFNVTEEAAQIALFMITVNSFMLTLRASNFTIVVGLLRGGGDVVTSAMVDLVPMYCLALPAALICGLALGYPGEIVYLVICLDEVSKFLFGVYRFRSRKWIKNLTREIA